MSRLAAIALALLGATLALAPTAGAVTVSSNTTLNCDTGAGAPAGMTFNAQGKRFDAAELTVNPGVTLGIASGATPPDCAIQVTGSLTVLGTLHYDQAGSMTRAGNLTAISGGNLTVRGTVRANGVSRGIVELSSAHGGNGGTVNLIGSALVVGPAGGSPGRVEANGGNGGSVLLGLLLPGNGGNAGRVVATGIFSADLAGATFRARPGSGGTAVVGSDGTPGADNGLVRRNAPEGATGGTVDAAVSRVNRAPTGLQVTSTAGGRTSLAWQDRSDEEAGFMVLRKVGSADYETAGTVGPNVTSFTDPAALAAGTQASFVVLGAFDPTIWPFARAFTNVVGVAGPPAPPPNGGIPTPPGTTPPPSTDPGELEGRFTTSLRRTNFRQRASLRRLRIPIRSRGNGRLEVRMRVRYRPSARSRRTRTRTVVRRMTVRRNRNHTVSLTLPRRWQPGRYRVVMTTIAPDTSRWEGSRSIRLRQRR